LPTIHSFIRLRVCLTDPELRDQLATAHPLRMRFGEQTHHRRKARFRTTSASAPL